MATERKKDNISHYIGNVATPHLLSVLQKYTGGWEVDLDCSPSPSRRECFFLHDDDMTGHPARAREYVLPALVDRSYARFAARLNPNFEFEIGTVVVPVPLYQDAAVEVCWEQSNPFRQLLLHAVTLDDQIDTSAHIQQNIPKCCKDKDAWLIERTLAPILANASGVFPTVDLRLKEEDSKTTLPLLQHYGHMMPMITEQDVYDPLGTKVAIFYLAFKIDDINAAERKMRKGADRYTHVWRNPSFVSVKLLPKIDVVVTNLPFLAHITYLMGSAHMDKSRHFLLTLASSTPLYQQIIPDRERAWNHFQETWPGRNISDDDTFVNLVHRKPMESMLQTDTSNASRQAMVYLYVSFAVVALVHAISPHILLTLARRINEEKDPDIAALQKKFINTCVTRWGVRTKNASVTVQHASHSPVIAVIDNTNTASSPEHLLVQQFVGLIKQWYSTLHKEEYEMFFNKFLDKAGYSDASRSAATAIHRFVASVLVGICGQ
jgi:hypothetical protein